MSNISPGPGPGPTACPCGRNGPNCYHPTPQEIGPFGPSPSPAPPSTPRPAPAPTPVAPWTPWGQIPLLLGTSGGLTCIFKQVRERYNNSTAYRAPFGLGSGNAPEPEEGAASASFPSEPDFNMTPF